MKSQQTLILISFIAACTVTNETQVSFDRNIGIAICDKLIDKYANTQNWQFICGKNGYFLSSAFLVKHNKVLEYNQIGMAGSWRDLNHQYSITPTRTFQGDAAALCREFRQTVQISSDIEILTGTACRQNNGVWKQVF